MSGVPAVGVATMGSKNEIRWWKDVSDVRESTCWAKLEARTTELKRATANGPGRRIYIKCSLQNSLPLSYTQRLHVKKGPHRVLDKHAHVFAQSIRRSAPTPTYTQARIHTKLAYAKVWMEKGGQLGILYRISNCNKEVPGRILKDRNGEWECEGARRRTA